MQLRLSTTEVLIMTITSDDGYTTCPACGGTGRNEDGTACFACNGTGQRQEACAVPEGPEHTGVCD